MYSRFTKPARRAAAGLAATAAAALAAAPAALAETVETVARGLDNPRGVRAGGSLVKITP